MSSFVQVNPGDDEVKLPPVFAVGQNRYPRLFTGEIPNEIPDETPEPVSEPVVEVQQHIPRRARTHPGHGSNRDSVMIPFFVDVGNNDFGKKKHTNKFVKPVRRPGSKTVPSHIVSAKPSKTLYSRPKQYSRSRGRTKTILVQDAVRSKSNCTVFRAGGNDENLKQKPNRDTGDVDDCKLSESTRNILRRNSQHNPDCQGCRNYQKLLVQASEIVFERDKLLDTQKKELEFLANCNIELNNLIKHKTGKCEPDNICSRCGRCIDCVSQSQSKLEDVDSDDHGKRTTTPRVDQELESQHRISESESAESMRQYLQERRFRQLTKRQPRTTTPVAFEDTSCEDLSNSRPMNFRRSHFENDSSEFESINPEVRNEIISLRISVAARQSLLNELQNRIKRANHVLNNRFGTFSTVPDLAITSVQYQCIIASHRKCVRWLNRFLLRGIEDVKKFEQLNIGQRTEANSSGSYYIETVVKLDGVDTTGVFIPIPLDGQRSPPESLPVPKIKTRNKTTQVEPKFAVDKSTSGNIHSTNAETQVSTDRIDVGMRGNPFNIKTEFTNSGYTSDATGIENFPEPQFVESVPDFENKYVFEVAESGEPDYGEFRIHSPLQISPIQFESQEKRGECLKDYLQGKTEFKIGSGMPFQYIPEELENSGDNFESEVSSSLQSPRNYMCGANFNINSDDEPATQELFRRSLYEKCRSIYSLNPTNNEQTPTNTDLSNFNVSPARSTVTEEDLRYRMSTFKSLFNQRKREIYDLHSSTQSSDYEEYSCRRSKSLIHIKPLSSVESLIGYPNGTNDQLCEGLNNEEREIERDFYSCRNMLMPKDQELAAYFPKSVQEPPILENKPETPEEPVSYPTSGNKSTTDRPCSRFESLHNNIRKQALSVIKEESLPKLGEPEKILPQNSNSNRDVNKMVAHISGILNPFLDAFEQSKVGEVDGLFQKEVETLRKQLSTTTDVPEQTEQSKQILTTIPTASSTPATSLEKNRDSQLSSRIPKLVTIKPQVPPGVVEDQKILAEVVQKIEVQKTMSPRKIQQKPPVSPRIPIPEKPSKIPNKAIIPPVSQAVEMESVPMQNKTPAVPEKAKRCNAAAFIPNACQQRPRSISVSPRVNPNPLNPNHNLNVYTTEYGANYNRFGWKK